jgi:hypothetical protein
VTARETELRRRVELSSYTLQMTVAVIRTLRAQIEELEERVAADEDAASLETGLRETGRAVERLWRFMRDAGVAPAPDVAPPEFVGDAPTMIVETEPPAGAAAAPPAAAVAGAPRPSLPPGALVTAPRWAGASPASHSARMCALVDGAPAQAVARFSVFVRGDARAVAVVDGVVQGGSAEATWSYGDGLLLALEPREENALFFVVEVAGARAESDLLPATALF